MSSFEMRLAALEDKQQITEFMDANWGSKHVLLHNEGFFKHYYVDGERLQFAMCFENGILIAVCGYIKASGGKPFDMWVSIWCAAKGKNGAGLELMAAMPSLCGCRVMACNNIRPQTMVFYSFLGYTAKRLPHFYRLAEKENYAVCKIADNTVLPVKQGKALIAVTDLNADFTPNESRVPFKDTRYLQRRYFDYPYAEYNVWRLEGYGKTDSLLVTRTVSANNVNVLKIVDYTGSPESFDAFGYGIDSLLKAENAEYAEMYCYGIAADIMNKAGFCERTEESVNIIPNYLTPLLQENTEYYFFTSDDNSFTMFKADGDQDRPNV